MKKEVHGSTHFRCDSCEKIKHMSERLLVTCLFTHFGMTEPDRWIGEPHYVQICKSCDEKGSAKEK